MKRIARLAALVGALVGVSAADARAGAAVGVAGPLDKIRPSDPVPAATAASLDAAANEFEPFQIVVGGGPAGVTGVTAVATMSGGVAMLYQVGLYEVVTPSNSEGAPGPWPDPLIPGVDAFAGEVRNGFPFDVAPGESRAIWVDVFVPPGTAAGTYTGSVTVTGGGLAATTVPVTLRVRAFALPSTATLKTAFGVRWDTCVAHLGSYAACGDPGIEEYNTMYARAALDDRVSLESVAYYGPDGTDWTRFDGWYAPLLDGTAPTRLAGAEMTTMRLMTGDAAEMTLWESHFAGNGWIDRLFDYTCDEPPAGCAFADIPVYAAPVHAAGLRTLVTADIDEVTANDFWDDIDILVPIVNAMEDRGGPDRRPEYDAFLAGGPQKELWWYQSCMSHGCGSGCVGTTDPYFTGWPSYVIDASGIQNRAMEWLSWSYHVTGELYFETTYMLATAWDDQCDFSGNGDGTLFYPGTPARIGGTTDVPVESLRLKLIREGQEDYEYLALLAARGDAALADAEAEALFPNPYSVTSATPADLFAARARIADRIEELGGGPPPPPMPETLEVPGVAAVVVDGVLDEFAGAPPLAVTVPGGARATFYAVWTADALCVGANVEDLDLWAPGTGRDGELYLSDGIEILLDPLRTHGATPDADDRHVIVTVASDLLDAAGAGAGEDRGADLGVQFAVTASGTLADGSPDAGYVVELSIPWAALGLSAPAEGLRLGVDLALNDAGPGGALDYADWAGLSTFANPDGWNELVLGAAPAAGGPPEGERGCGCRVVGARGGAAAPGLLLAALAAFVRRGRGRGMHRR